MKILVAEDERICQSAIVNLGKRLGVETDIANNGKEAIEKVSQFEYNMILMDMFMPEMNGNEATVIIRSMPNGIKPIIISLSGGIFITIIKAIKIK